MSEETKVSKAQQKAVAKYTKSKSVLKKVIVM